MRQLRMIVEMNCLKAAYREAVVSGSAPMGVVISVDCF